MVVHFFRVGLVLILAGCSSGAGIGPFETSETLLPADAVRSEATVHAPIALRPAAGPDCAPMPHAVMEEAQRYTPFTPDWRRALLLSEIQKNRALAEAIAAYEACRKL